MKSVAGDISVPNGRKHDLLLFNNTMNMLLPVRAPSYLTLSPEQRLLQMNVILTMDARSKAHAYVLESISRITVSLRNTINQDVNTFAHLPRPVRENIFRTLQLSYSFTPACRAPAISDNLTVTELRGKLDIIKNNNTGAYRSISRTLDLYKRGFLEGDRFSIAARAVRAHKYQAVIRAKYLIEG